MKNRLECAKKYSQLTAEAWAKVIWSDVSKISRLGSDGCEWEWKTTGEKLQRRHEQATLKFGGCSIMIWGCMMSNGVGTVYGIQGKMTAASYVD